MYFVAKCKLIGIWYGWYVISTVSFTSYFPLYHDKSLKYLLIYRSLKTMDILWRDAHTFFLIGPTSTRAIFKYLLFYRHLVDYRSSMTIIRYFNNVVRKNLFWNKVSLSRFMSINRYVQICTLRCLQIIYLLTEFEYLLLHILTVTLQWR